MMKALETIFAQKDFLGKIFPSHGKEYKIKAADDFSYVDPIDKSVSSKQVLQLSRCFQ